MHLSENRVIVSKIIFYVAINISGSPDKNFKILLCMEMTMYQCIMLYHQHKP